MDLKAQALQQEVAQVTRAVKSGKFSAGGSAPAMGMRRGPAAAAPQPAAAPTDRLEQQLNQMQARRMALERYASFLPAHACPSAHARPLSEEAATATAPLAYYYRGVAQ